MYKRYIIVTIHLFAHLLLFDRLQFVHTRAQHYDKTNLLRAWTRGFIHDALYHWNLFFINQKMIKSMISVVFFSLVFRTFSKMTHHLAEIKSINRIRYFLISATNMISNPWKRILHPLMSMHDIRIQFRIEVQTWVTKNESNSNQIQSIIKWNWT